MHAKKIISEYAAACFGEQLDLLRELGKIPAPSRREDLRAEFCKNWLLEQGAKDVSIDFAKNVICKINCENAREYTVFAAHTDIVFPDTQPLAMTEDAEKIYAPGIGDDTSNLVNLLMAAKYIIKNKLKTKCGILIVANSCEEGLGNLDGTKALFKTYGEKITAFYSFDGYMPQCCSKAVGSYRYSVTCKTTGGHSFLDFGRANAIEVISAVINDLYKITPPQNAQTTYNVGRIEGGTTVNSIAQECSMLYEFRSTGQDCLEFMDKAFKQIIDKHQKKDAPITLELLGVRPGDGDLDRKKLKKFTAETAEIISEYCPGDIDFGAYSTDSNVPLSMGIMANTVGTVKGGGAHTRQEWIYKNSLADGLKIAMSLMFKYVVE